MSRKPMTFVNESRHPTDEVRALVRFALQEIETRDLHVHLTAGGWGGRGGRVTRDHRAWPKHVLQAIRKRDRQYGIWVRVPETDDAHTGEPHTYHGGDRGRWVKHGDSYEYVYVQSGSPENPGRWPVVVHNDWREYIVGLVAHEGKHVEQYREGLRLSEIAAEWFEHYTIRRFRQHEAAQALPAPLEFATVGG